jgi:hypothetical protein
MTAIITQLANAGGYRILKKEDADSIPDYDRMYRNDYDFEKTAYQDAQKKAASSLIKVINEEYHLNNE